MTKRYKRVPFELIVKAKDGDMDAIETIKNHYQPYIRKLTLRLIIDDQGSSHVDIDDVLKNRIETKLLNKILSFKIDFN